MNYKYIISFILGALLLGAVTAQATGAYPYVLGGTGSSTIPALGQLFYAGTTAWQSTPTTSVTCSGSASCTAFTVLGASPITIVGSASGGSFPFSPDSNFGQVVYSTSTPTLWFKSGVFASSTSDFVNLLLTSATSTYLAATNNSAGCGQFNADGALISTGVSCGTDTFAWPFTPGTFGTTVTSATSTAINDTGGLISTASSTIELLSIFNGTTTNATSTNVDISGQLKYGSTSGCLQAASGVLSILASNCNSGTVTSIAAGLGLNGGTITTSGTISEISYLATSTGETDGNLAYWTSTAGVPATLGKVATSSIAVSAGLTNTGTLGSQVGGSSLTLEQLENRSFSYATSSWTGTTTIALETGYGELWNNAKCWTIPSGSTVDVDFVFSSITHVLPFIIASSTNGTTAFTSNNTITSGATTTVSLGTPASSPTQITCTINDTI